MMIFKNNEKKVITFDLMVEGAREETLDYFFRFSINGVEYGFKGDLQDGKLIFEIPPLKEFTSLTNEDKIDARLDVSGGNHYACPWSDKVSIERTPVITTRMTETRDVSEGLKVKTSSPKVKENVVTEEKIEKRETKPSKFRVSLKS